MIVAHAEEKVNVNRYFSTFPAGTYEIIVKHLKRFSLDELNIIEHDDSSVVFESSLKREKLIELRYLTNTHLVIDKHSHLDKRAIEGKYFRLMLIKDGEPSQISAAERAKLETAIKCDYNLELNSHLSRNEFYIIERSSGNKFLTLRLPRAKFKRERLSSGELRPELAHILCLAAGLKAKYKVVDMFAGYGAIPYEAVRGFGCKGVIANDCKILSNRHENSKISWSENDACNLNFIDDDSIDRVITDPHWGEYDVGKVDNFNSLYDDFVIEMARILKPDGIAVVLSGFVGARQSFKKVKHLKPIKEWNMLVSGKKATIYKLQKIR